MSERDELGPGLVPDYLTSVQEGVFIDEYGSWDRSDPVGYKVVFVPSSNGQPYGAPFNLVQDFSHKIIKRTAVRSA